MRRFAGLLLAAALLAAVCAGPLDAQSMAKKDGPVVKLDNLKSQTYGYWKEEKKAPKPAVYQFVLPETLKSTRDESGILTITPVTDDQKTLFDELKKMMVPPEGKKIDDIVKLTKIKTAGAGEVTQMYFFGTIQEGPGSAAKKKEKQRVLAIVLPTKEKKYLITLIGPSRAIGGSQGNFINWVKDFK